MRGASGQVFRPCATMHCKHAMPAAQAQRKPGRSFADGIRAGLNCSSRGLGHNPHVAPPAAPLHARWPHARPQVQADTDQRDRTHVQRLILLASWYIRYLCSRSVRPSAACVTATCNTFPNSSRCSLDGLCVAYVADRRNGHYISIASFHPSQHSGAADCTSPHSRHLPSCLSRSSRSASQYRVSRGTIYNHRRSGAPDGYSPL